MRTKSKTRVKHKVHFTLELAIETPDITPRKFTELLNNLRDEVEEALDEHILDQPNQELVALDKVGGSLNRISIS